MFDLSKETPNDINAVAGESVLKWAVEQLKENGYESTPPEAEDWGWCAYVTGRGVRYLVGASADPTETTTSADWTIQIHRERSLKDRFTGRNKLTPDDPLSALIEGILRADPEIDGVYVDRRA